MSPRKAGCQPHTVAGACQGNLPSPAPQDRGEPHSASPSLPRSDLVYWKNNSALNCAGTELGAAAGGARSQRRDQHLSPRKPLLRQSPTAADFEADLVTLEQVGA